MTSVSNPAALCDRLAAIVGAKHVSRDPDELSPWLTDWRGRVTGDAAAMVSPGKTQEVQEIVRLAGEANIPIVPQGGNTGMVAGGVPRPGEGAILLSLRRMDAIRAIDPDDASLVAEAGVILTHVHQAAAGEGMRFPLSLGAKDSATIGGLVSTNAGGVQVLRFGTMRSLVLGIEAVLPDGSRFDGLSSLRKDNRGYDLKQLLIGAEGTLGIVTAASLKLYPAAPHRVVGWAGIESADHALKLLRRLERALGQAVETFELVPAGALALVLDHLPDARAPIATRTPWNALIEARTANDRARLYERFEQAMAEAYDEGLVGDATIATSETQAEQLWRLRETIPEAERRESGGVKHDVSVPVSAMPGFIETATAAVEEAFVGARVNAFGHLGDGNVHFNVRAPEAGNPEVWLGEQGKAVTRLVHDLVTAAGGSLSAEHGIGLLKRDEFARLADPAHLATLRGIKRALDPLGIMNPGKLLAHEDDPPS
ncbi:MAG: FAD-binding oxidoreductase [Sphingomonadales bacterium]|nr:FAD-binding oxidoreductase [Sphingomonadales bacterium]